MITIKNALNRHNVLKDSCQWLASKFAAISSYITARTAAAQDTKAATDEEVTPAQYEGIITKDIYIDGALRCGSNLKIYGVVNGDVTCRGNIDVTNQVIGNISGKRVYLYGAKITGNVAAAETIRHEKGVVNGSIEACNAEIDGTVNGDIKVSELLNIRKNAVINGDIHAAMVSIAKKAVINGKLCIPNNERQ